MLKPKKKGRAKERKGRANERVEPKKWKESQRNNK